MLGLRSGGGHAMVHSEEELKMLVTASQEAGVLEEHEEQMLHRVFGFADLTAGQVMVPRTELVAVAADAAARRADRSRSAESGHTRLPVYRDDLDNVVGMLHVTDLLKALAAGDMDVNAGALAREALTVPETLGADDLLAEMRRRARPRGDRHRRIRRHRRPGHLRIADGADRRRDSRRDGGADAHRHPRPDGSADIDGLALVTDVNEQFGLHIDEDTYTTIGGYVLGRLGRRAARRRHDRGRRPQDAGRGARRPAGGEGVAVEAEHAGRHRGHGANAKDTTDTKRRR